MPNMQILVKVGMPEPDAPSTSEKHLPIPVEDKVRYALECIDSGHDSPVDWLMINKLYEDLKRMKPSERIQNLISMIEPVLSKFGYHGISNGGSDR